MTDTASAVPSEREQFERHVKAYTGRDIEYHQRNGTTGLEFGWACWQAARAQTTASVPRRRAAMTEPTDAELWQLHMQMPGVHKDPIDFARAVLAKWGTPQPTQPQAGALESAEFGRFLSDVLTAAGLVTYGKQCKQLGERLGAAVMKLRAHGIKGGQHGTE